MMSDDGEKEARGDIGRDMIVMDEVMRDVEARVEILGGLSVRNWVAERRRE